MRTDTERLCDMPRITGKSPRGCTREATALVHCTVEGRDFDFCQSCKAGWVARVSLVPSLGVRCPNCAPQAEVIPVMPIPPNPERPVTDIFAEAMDHAMRMEGVLEPTRRRVMARLAHEAPWMCEAEAV